MNDWKEIWSNKQMMTDEYPSLESLIELDGFDSGGDDFTSNEWIQNIEFICSKMKINNGDSVFEVGCGSGAFLFALRELFSVKVAGLDYSKSLIQTAQKVFKDELSFQCRDAQEMEVTPTFDHVIAYSVFHYMQYEDSINVLTKMLRKSTKTVGLFELPNADLQVESEDYRQSNMGLSEEEYKKKYKGLPHTYFSYEELKDIGRRLDFRVEKIQSENILHSQSKFRFGVVFNK